MGIFRRSSGVGATPLDRLERKLYRIEEFLQSEYPEIPPPPGSLLLPPDALEQVTRYLQARHEALASLLTDGYLPEKYVREGGSGAKASVIGAFAIDPSTLTGADSAVPCTWATTTGHGIVLPRAGTVTDLTCNLTAGLGVGSGITGTLYVDGAASALAVTVTEPIPDPPGDGGTASLAVAVDTFQELEIQAKHNGTVPASGSALFLLWGYLT